MSRRRNELAPNLFPFLAVLVCTLGTLILFLALVAQNATDAAQQEAARSAESPAEAEDDAPATRLTSARAEQLIAEGEYRVEQLVSHRTKQTAELAEKRDELTHLEEHLRRIAKQLRRLRDEVETAMSENEHEPDTDDLVLLREEIEAEQEALEQLESEQQDREPRVVIVPHQGPNGTDRRPVYLECTADGLTVWPEGASISISQLRDSTPAANPLDSVLRVVRHHAMQHYQDPIPPYPLLVVRPGGIDTYAAARRAMADWDDQFGYELVASETELAFPSPDSELRDRIERAIQEAVQGQQAQQHFVAGAQGQRSTASGPHASGSAAGPGSAPRRGSAGPLPTLSAAKLDRMSRAGGYKEASGSNAASVADPLDRFSRSARRQNASPSRSWDGSELAESRNTTEQLDQRLQEAAGQTDGSQQGTADGVPTEIDTQRGDDSHRGAEAAPGNDAAPEAETRPADQELSEQDSLAGRSGTLQQPDQDGSGDDDQRPAGRGAASAPRDQPRNQADGASASPNGMSSPPPQSSDSQPQQAPSSVNAQASESPPRSDLVKRQGNDWALPKQMAGIRGTSVVRSMRVVCYPDRFVLLPPSSGGGIQVFGVSDRDPRRATLELATAVRDRVARWGAPLPGGRWQPRLEVELAPQAEARFEQLKAFMSDSGVEVRHVPSSEGSRR